MLATKPNLWGPALKSEVKYMLLDFQENTEGKFVAGFRKPRDFIDGYGQICYNTYDPSMKTVIGVQCKRTYEWTYTAEAREVFNVQMEQFDDAVLIYVDKKPKGYWEFSYRFDTELQR